MPLLFMPELDTVKWKTRSKEESVCLVLCKIVDFFPSTFYLVMTRTPGGVTVGDSGLCCCAPCLSSAINSLCLSLLTF